MELCLIGINHRTALVDVREKLWFSDEELRSVLSVLKAKYFSECFIISTCNRTELYGIGDNVPIEDVIRYLLEFKSVSNPETRGALYVLRNCRAASHLFKLASGTDSMIVGDIQILNQVKTHYNLALESQTTGTYAAKLVQTAFHVGKRTRFETSICEGAVSVSYAAVELSNKIFSNLAEKSALLIGAGETGEITAKNLVARGVGRLTIANRTRSKADELAGSIGGASINFEDLHAHLKDVDIVISSVNSPTYIITADQVRRTMRERSNAPLLIVDIGVPRNIDPEVNKLDNVFVHTMDSLSRIVDQNMNRRRTEIPAVNAIIFEELSSLVHWFESLQVNPTISDLREMFESVRADEVKKHINRFAKDDRELVEIVTKRIVNKLLHLPTTNLKNGTGSGDSIDERHSRIDAIRTLFGLHKPADNGADRSASEKTSHE
ncbi:MAG TPA: glutamyl-tRNA reductase [Bacteroidota bacterium]|nr:glutamyl-tRNA reductase [Bacteroidota bacterium]